MDRREFVLSSCAVCIGALAFGALPGCAASSVFEAQSDGSTIRVPIDKFQMNKTLVVHTDLERYKIVVVKHSDTEYQALLLECTHQNNPLTVTTTGIFCPAHGSAFDLDGNVTVGPASAPLKQFKTSVANGEIAINLAS